MVADNPPPPPPLPFPAARIDRPAQAESVAELTGEMVGLREDVARYLAGIEKARRRAAPRPPRPVDATRYRMTALVAVAALVVGGALIALYLLLRAGHVPAWW